MTIKQNYHVYSCIGECPFYKTEQGHLMYCSHPRAETMKDQYIITQQNGHDRVPDECHLKEHSVIKYIDWVER